MSKHPSEIFGHPFYVTTKQVTEDRANHWCPFVDKVCYKQSRLIDYPFGVCSARVNDADIALCPRRFLDHHSVFADIAQHHFKTTSDILVFPEIRLTNIGSFDFVMLKHKPMSSEIEDFVAIEFQTGQTTGTGALVQGLVDYLAGKSIIYQSYNFGINSYDIWKRTFTQVLNKGIVMENWGHKIYWVVQEPVYQYFETRYNLKDIGFNEQHATIFALYDLVPAKTHFDLASTRKVSASIDQLFSAFRNNPHIPPLEPFVRGLQAKMSGQAQLSLKLDHPSRVSQLDIKPPSESGRVRDASDEGRKGWGHLPSSERNSQ